VSIKDSPLVFVGYGVQAPEYHWDDYAGLDVKGKMLVMLINDPAVQLEGKPGELDPAYFKGSAMTYYGRWTYKYEIASKLGAAGAIIVHQTEPAAYPWSVVRHSWTGEQFELESTDGNQGSVPIRSWITLDKARELFKDAGQDFDQLADAARKPGFKPVPLDATASFTISNTIRRVTSHNVAAIVPGTDPELSKQWVIYTAHWDHLGKDDSLEGDQIFNGAQDNASGVAGLLEIARITEAAPTRRSQMFLAVTAEEQGLLGSGYYTEHPLVPLKNTVAEINMDALGMWGPTRDIQIIGMGQSSLEDTLSHLAKARDREVVADTSPEKGFYFRSDQLNFAKHGVPALYTKTGTDVIGKPGYGEERMKAYIEHDYHNVSDEVKPDWDLTGTATDLQLLHDVGNTVANDTQVPTWKDDSEFKAAHEALMAGGA